MHMLSDSNSRVRSSALKMLTTSLGPVRRLPRSDASVFTEYILPTISNVRNSYRMFRTDYALFDSFFYLIPTTAGAGPERVGTLYASSVYC